MSTVVLSLYCSASTSLTDKSLVYNHIQKKGNSTLCIHFIWIDTGQDWANQRAQVVLTAACVPTKFASFVLTYGNAIEAEWDQETHRLPSPDRRNGK